MPVAAFCTKAAGIRKSLCLDLKINKEKKKKQNTNFLLFCALIFVNVLTKGSE